MSLLRRRRCHCPHLTLVPFPHRPRRPRLALRLTMTHTSVSPCPCLIPAFTWRRRRPDFCAVANIMSSSSPPRLRLTLTLPPPCRPHLTSCRFHFPQLTLAIRGNDGDDDDSDATIAVARSSEGCGPRLLARVYSCSPLFTCAIARL